MCCDSTYNQIQWRYFANYKITLALSCPLPCKWSDHSYRIQQCWLSSQSSRLQPLWTHPHMSLLRPDTPRRNHHEGVHWAGPHIYATCTTWLWIWYFIIRTNCQKMMNMDLHGLGNIKQYSCPYGTWCIVSIVNSFVYLATSIIGCKGCTSHEAITAISSDGIGNILGLTHHNHGRPLLTKFLCMLQ